MNSYFFFKATVSTTSSAKPSLASQVKVPTSSLVFHLVLSLQHIILHSTCVYLHVCLPTLIMSLSKTGNINSLISSAEHIRPGKTVALMGRSTGPGGMHSGPESPQSEPTAFSTSQQTPHSPAQTHTSIMDYPLHFHGAPDRDLRWCPRP